MLWTLRSRSYHSPPYRIEPGVMGWSVWKTEIGSLTCVGKNIESLRAAKSLARHHSELNAVKA